MKIPLHIAKKLRQLSNGEVLPAGSAKHRVIDNMVDEEIIERSGRIHKKLVVKDPQGLGLYLQNKFGINNLDDYIAILEKEDLRRSDLTAVSSNSKLLNIRTFKGFLINSYLPVNGKLNGKEMVLDFEEGIFRFIYDFEGFIPDSRFTIVGIENPENFRWIKEQRQWFSDIHPLFVSRYPQSQSKDLISWLQSIPNQYLHFGDFDFAGIAIYHNEFKVHLQKKASFFIPKNIDELIFKYGNTHNYDNQLKMYDFEGIEETQVLELLKLLHKHKKGLEQEVLLVAGR